ncbi:CPCC family cysteine-rich protein [Ferruginibacter profundus]
MKIIQAKDKNLFTCPCCGYKTLKEKPPGTFEICRVCWWEDDNLQFDNPDSTEGANNGMSLREWQKDFYEVEENKKLIFKNLAPVPENKWYDFDENWKPLDESSTFQ